MRSDPQRRLTAVARHQHGLFTVRQAVGAGFARTTIARRLDDGEWGRVERHVLRGLPAPALSWRQRAMGRVLATGGVVSHHAAGAMYGLLDEPPVIEITVHRSARTASHVSVHSTLDLQPCDITSVDAIPTTSPVRTLLDLGTVLPRGTFEDVLDAALFRRLVSPRHLASRATELWTPRRAGCAVVLELLDARSPQAANVASTWEARVLRALRSLRFPEPRCNHPVVVGGRRRVIDFAWPEHRVLLEFDGFAFHSSRRAFDDDRTRQNDLVDAGWRPFRVTANAFASGSRRALAPLARALGLDW